MPKFLLRAIIQYVVEADSEEEAVQEATGDLTFHIDDFDEMTIRCLGEVDDENA